MPRRIYVFHRIIRGVAVPVQALRVARACPERSEGSRHDGVRLDEAAYRRILLSGVVVVQPNCTISALADVHKYSIGKVLTA